jgi:anti-sigma factor RsiW
MFKRKCVELQALISAGIDGELTEEQVVVLQTHLAECPDNPNCSICRDSMAILEAVKGRLRDLPEPSEELSRQLSARVQNAITNQPRSRFIGRTDWRYRFAFMGAAAAAILFLVFALTSRGPHSAVKAAVDLHEQHIAADTAEVRSHDPADLETYFAAELGVRFTVHDLSEAGWELSGGSICEICGSNAVHVDYHKGSQELSIFMLQECLSDKDEIGESTDFGARITEHRDDYVILWTGSEGDCILVGEDEEEASAIAAYMIK